MSIDIFSWILFIGIILVMLGLDLFLFHRKARHVSVREAVYWSLFWIGLALLFNLYVYFAKGRVAALNFLTGYLVEESLSIDNLFVFLLIFDYFRTPKTSYHKVLFWGVLGAIIMRAIFICSGLALIQKFEWLIYLFGAFLIFTGIKFGMSKDQKIQPEKNPVLKLFRSLFPVTESYENDRFFIKRGKSLIATPLFVVVLCIETTDIVFATDSIPAILAITYDPFIVYSSNIFAILGLRSIFFALSGIMGLFEYLHYGLSCILVLIGLKMLFSHFLPIPIEYVFGTIFVILSASIAASILKKTR